MSATLLLRADADAGTGSGHVMRALAIAEAWNNVGRQALFLTTSGDSPVFRKMQETMEVLAVPGPPGSAADAEATAQIARERDASWVVADGYGFGGEYQRAVKGRGLRLLSIDDGTTETHWHADLILNQNLHADESLYANREDYTRLLLGTRFVLLRQEFLRARDNSRNAAERGRKVLVTLGGGDHKNVSARVLEALDCTGLPELDCVVVVGPANPHIAELSSLRDRLRFPVRLQEDASDMAQLMTWADLGVVAGGITTWEALYMKLPIVVIFAVENQRPNAERLGPLGAGLNLGPADEFDPATSASKIKDLLADASRRETMAEAGRRLVDGDGVYRLMTRLRGRKLRLRRAEAADSQKLFEWANEAEVRAVSFSSRPIAPKEHEEWFARTLRDRRSLLFIAVDEEDRPVGQVRFDLEGDEALISVSIDQTLRGSGLGTSLIESGVEEAAGSAGASRVKAFVKPENRRSARAFEKAGFRRAGEETVKGQPALVYIREATLAG